MLIDPNANALKLQRPLITKNKRYRLLPSFVQQFINEKEYTITWKRFECTRGSVDTSRIYFFHRLWI